MKKFWYSVRKIQTKLFIYFKLESETRVLFCLTEVINRGNKRTNIERALLDKDRRNLFGRELRTPKLMTITSDNLDWIEINEETMIKLLSSREPTRITEQNLFIFFGYNIFNN